MAPILLSNSNIWELINNETRRQAITKDQKNEMKAKPMEF